jgi:adenylate cyclase
MMTEVNLKVLSIVGETSGNLGLRIGIATGDAIVGNLGDDRFSDYTVIGNRVNFAKRLEESSRFYGVGILIDEPTMLETGGVFLWREIDTVRVKGKRIPEKIFELIGINDGRQTPIASDVIINYENGLAAYREGDWKKATEFFRKGAMLGDMPSVLFMKRIEGKEAPSDWDGITEWNGK